MFNLGRLRTRDCQGLTRRELLQVGTCSALGLSLPQWLAGQAQADVAKPSKVKSVLLLWLWGGPSHHEMWDPKPDAPSQIRGCYNPIATATPGTQISELLPQLARRTDKYAIIRSMNHDQKDHNVGGTIGLTGHVFGAKASGGIPFPGTVRPSIGSLISYMHRGHSSAWPAFTCIGPICKVSGENLRGQMAGVLGAPHDPFRLEGFSFEEGVRVPRSLEPLREISTDRLGTRRSLLTEIDTLQKQLEASGEVGRYDDLRQKAFALVTSATSKGALNLDAESEALRDRYGRTIYGQNLIIGRRLVEAGVPFVQVNWSGDAEDEQQGGDGGWDLHYRLFERMQERYCPIYDRALSALLDDMQDRGLLETTLVIAMGEFGRSPQISGAAGREHWPWVYSAFVAGGGVPGGLVLGSSSADGGYPRSHPVHPANLISTVFHKMGLDRLALGDRDASVLEGPIAELG
nr:DUF1501 domain-containing protein [uncultured bacterium]